MKYRWYQRFFKLHCYIWRIFWISVAVPAILAIIYIGWPFYGRAGEEAFRRYEIWQPK